MDTRTRDDANLIVQGRLATFLGSAPARAAAGRTCARAGCRTRLSIYNVGRRCWQHTEPRPAGALRSWSQKARSIEP